MPVQLTYVFLECQKGDAENQKSRQKKSKMEKTKNQIKVLSELIRKYKLEDDVEKVKQLQAIGLDLACEVLIESDKDKIFSHTKGEFITIKKTK